MKRFLLALPLIVAASCGGDASTSQSGEPRPGVDGTSTPESTMVVATEAGVPSDGRPTVVFLGTSLTAGLGIEREEDTYAAVLGAMGDSAGLPFRVVNAGVSGETSAGGLRRLDWVLRTPFDILVVELGANDGLRGQDPAQLGQNLQAIVRRTRARHPDARVLLAGMEAPPNLGPSYTAAFRAVFPDVAERENVTLIPFLLDGVAGVPELNQSDRIHPTAEGHRRIAENVWPLLADELRSLGGAP